MDPTPLRNAYRALLEAAATAAESRTTETTEPGGASPPAGGWDADQVMAHVALINAATIGAVTAVATGAVATYDNRLAQDAWTIARVVTLTGGSAGLRERVRAQGEALCALTGPSLTDTELDTPVPALLLSNGTALVDRPLRLRDILTGLAEVELPGHARQLLALRHR
jgi:hypothetical protein